MENTKPVKIVASTKKFGIIRQRNRMIIGVKLSN